ncbi:hypothetical protein ACFWP3_34920 [Streptomyces sp. NPDC058525]|uniref:hypothetical protein n=1 Tax=Streptomyces sp. NPDC058525 TaxID=3346538 RepID=UPI0036604CC0
MPFSVRTIKACANVVTAHASARPARTEAVSKCLRGTERAILRGPNRFGTVPRSSPRRKRLKLHARLVAAALRQPEVRLDTHPVEAAKELSQLLVTVVDNYASGRLGALLPEETLKDLGATLGIEIPWTLIPAAVVAVLIYPRLRTTSVRVVADATWAGSRAQLVSCGAADSVRACQ